MTALSRIADADVPRRELDRREAQIGLLFAAIVLTAVTSLAVSLLFPRADDAGPIPWAAVQRDSLFVWAFLTAAGVNLILAVVANAIAAVLLVPARGWRWATAGFAVALVGVSLYAVAVGGWAMLSYFTAESTALDSVTAAAFVATVNGDPSHSYGPAVAGALLVVAAVLLLSVGLWRSGNVPRWVIALGVIGSIITFVPAPDGIAGTIIEIPQVVSSVMIGWYLWRCGRAV